MTKKDNSSYHNTYYQRNREVILRKRRESWDTYYASHKLEIRAKTNKRRWEIKAEVLTHYGNGKLACIICGFVDIRALTIDHINGGGRKERMELGRGFDRGGVKFYRWLKYNNYPKGYQTLCMNCQLIKQIKTPLEFFVGFKPTIKKVGDS